MIPRSLLKFLSRSSSHKAGQGIGRWTIHYEPAIITQKVNWANEDHCGVCVLPPAENEVIEMLGCCSEVPSAR